jgi:hypothetical protein
VTVLLLIVFGACVVVLLRASLAYDRKLLELEASDEQPAYLNPVREFLDPFGSKAFNIFLCIVLPLLALLALWNDVIATFISFQRTRRLGEFTSRLVPRL